MKALSIAWVNLVRLFRDRSNIFFVLILPLGIILIIGSLFGGSDEPQVGVVVETEGPRAAALVTAITESDGIEVERYPDVAAVVGDVERGNLTAGVVIPAGYDAQLAAGDNVTVGYVTRADNTGLELRNTIAAAIAEQSEVIRAVRFAVANGASADTAEQLAGAVGETVSPIDVTVTAVGEALFPDTLGEFDLGASSQMILFMFLTGLVGASALIQTRNYGVSRRMLSTATPVRTIVVGEALGRFAVVLFQGLYIIFTTLVIFGVNWGDPAGAAAIVVLFAAVSTGAAMLVGAIADNDQQAGGLGVVAGIGIGALGGSMLPVELFSDTMRTIAHVTPHAWALDGFAELVRRDGSMADILPELAALGVFAIVLIAAASWRFRASLVRSA